jgi:hypothetical protein
MSVGLDEEADAQGGDADDHIEDAADDPAG